MEINLRFNPEESIIGFYAHSIVTFDLEEGESEIISEINFQNKEMTKQTRILIGFIAYIEIII